ncbi:hypothetical protein JRO89_XS13G0209700 [Xanthoceras sorbifolium]|uniref:Uncharacterized protein n=1 Tax=Xanthoceras sorbifolium TaxID=99658 RepID=A0ABQ8H9F0_9ROSI|nr:hypothetical protein JRO89_XS13G0209700 [Xanthoceras sorbifolium]
MNSMKSETTSVRHMVAMPYPGRSHINSMMNLCKLLVSRTDDKLILITFVVTEEWLLFIGSEPKPDNIRFASISNIIPSELGRAADINGLFEAVLTKMEAPFEQLLDRIEPPVTLIMSDSILFWAVGVGNRRNIPVASFWPMSATMFSRFQHWDLLVQNGQYLVDLLVTHMYCGDSVTLFLGCLKHNISYSVQSTSSNLEPLMLLRAKFSFPVYTIGPLIPCFKLGDNPSLSAQMDEIAAGLSSSGVRFLWVARGETSRLEKACGEMGLLVPWCDQLRVLSHACVGGFWTHCGWNSVQEGIFAGVPLLNFPLGMDQITNSKLIVEDWKIGWRIKKEVVRVENFLVSRDTIREDVVKFMDMESSEGKQMRRRVKELQEKCQHEITKDGSSEINIKSFIRDISLQHSAH